MHQRLHMRYETVNVHTPARFDSALIMTSAKHKQETRFKVVKQMGIFFGKTDSVLTWHLTNIRKYDDVTWGVSGSTDMFIPLASHVIGRLEDPLSPPK